MKEFPAKGWQITQTISALAFFFCVQARAHVYVVTETNDTTSVTSLRGAIIDANARGGENTIILGEEPDPRRREPVAAWTFYLTIQGADEDAAQTGDLDITDGKLTIIGATPNVTIDAAGLGDRVFQVFSNAQLTLEGITIEGGATPFNTNYSFGEPGGAIFNAGTLIMQDCVISGNSVGVGTSSGTDIDGINSNNISLFLNGGNGGGIFNIGNAQLDNCVISSNSAGAGYTSQTTLAGINGGDGGGIYNLGKVVLNECIISDNLSGAGGVGGSLSGGGSAAPPGGAGGNGAGIFNDGEMGVNFCRVNGNLGGAGGTGGTLSFYGPPGAGGTGGSGGVFNIGSLMSTSCTITLNLAGAGGNGGSRNPSRLGTGSNIPASGGQGGGGGGILNATNNVALVLRNTLIALNSANSGGLSGTNFDEYLDEYFDVVIVTNIGNPGANGVGPDLSGGFTSHGFNLIGAADGSTGLTSGVLADQVGSTNAPIDPVIGPLQMNGGPTATHALLRGSPAINKGNCFGVHQDQRGEFRPFDSPGISFALGGDGSDIGAFELHVNERFEPPRDIFDRR